MISSFTYTYTYIYLDGSLQYICSYIFLNVSEISAKNLHSNISKCMLTFKYLYEHTYANNENA